MTRERGRSLLSAVALIGALLGLLASGHPVPGTAPAASRGAAAGGPVRAAPAFAGLTLASVWPGARSVDFPAVVAGGSAFQPLAVLDPGLAVGTSTDAGQSWYSLSTVTPDGRVRVLETRSTADSPTVDAFTATVDEYLWIQTLLGPAGTAVTSLWHAPRAAGPASLLSSDVGPGVFTNSRFDLQVVGGRVYWVAAVRGSGQPTQLRSVGLSGGRVEARDLPGDYVLSAWPWLTTDPGAAGSAMELLNVLTGGRHPVPAPSNQDLTCTPAWCRMLAANVADARGIDLIRPDGSGRRRIADAQAAAVAGDVALRDRFEVLATPVTAGSPSGFAEKVELYDIARGRHVLLAGGASDCGARGDYVWWSGGQGPAAVWHALDLASLG